VQNNGHSYARLAHDDASNNVYLFYGTNFTTIEGIAGWDWDTRNRTLFADRGMRQSLSGSITMPSSDIHYWIANYQFVKYVPLGRHFTLSFLEGVDYGQPFGNTTAIPPFRQFFGGGPDSVRGFRESRLGPKDQFGNPFGGNLRVTSQNELILPMPAKWAQTARVSAFFDIGNIYETGNFYKFTGPYGTPQSYGWGGFGSLKRSVGMAVQWLAPLGLFRFSYGVPLNAKKVALGEDAWGDQTEGFQFSVGNAF
jgi:outer membrane protein insertion porin family